MTTRRRYTDLLLPLELRPLSRCPELCAVLGCEEPPVMRLCNSVLTTVCKGCGERLIRDERWREVRE